MDLKRLPQACDPVQLNENLFAAADQLEASRHSRPARRMVEKFTEFELCLATAALGVAAVAREVFVAIAGSSLVLVKLGLHVTRALTKSRVCEKAYKQLPGKQSCIHQTKRIFGQTLGIGTSLIGAALFWCKGVKWDISAQKRLGNYHPDKPVTKPKPAIQLKPNVLNHQLEEPAPNLLQQPGEPPADAVQIATQGAAPGSLPQGVPQQMQAIIPKAPPTPKGKVPARKQPVPPARGKAAAQAISQTVPTPPPRAQGPAPASPQPVPTPPPRAQVNVAPPPPPRAQVPAPATSPVVTPPPAQGSVPPPPPRTQADGAQQQAPANPPVGPAVVPPRPPPPPPPSRFFSPPRDPRNQPPAAAAPAPAAQQPPAPAAAATSASDSSITSPRSKRLSAQLAEQMASLNQGTAAQVEAERKAAEDARKAALKQGTMRTNTKNNISAILQGTAPKPAAAPARRVLDPKPNAAQGGWILDFEQNLYDFETTYDVEICKQGEEIDRDIIKLVDYIKKYHPSPNPGDTITLKSGGELEVLPPKDGVPLAWFKHPDFPAASGN